jgi:hypothetical protein
MNAARQHILAEIKRLVEASGGKPPGFQAFQRETGIKRGDWFPKLWIRWGDALERKLASLAIYSRQHRSVKSQS